MRMNTLCAGSRTYIKQKTSADVKASKFRVQLLMGTDFGDVMAF